MTDTDEAISRPAPRADVDRRRGPCGARATDADARRAVFHPHRGRRPGRRDDLGVDEPAAPGRGLEYPWPPERWRRYLQAQLDGEYSRPLIGSFRGTELAYVEVYRAAKDSIAPRYAADPYDLGLHAAIADLRFVNRGFAPILLPRLVASIFEIEPRCRRIMFDPDHRNSGARRLCEFAGCAFLGEHQMSNRRMALYALPRTPGRAGSVIPVGRVDQLGVAVVVGLHRRGDSSHSTSSVPPPTRASFMSRHHRPSGVSSTR